MILKHWNYGADWWLFPSIFVKNTEKIFELGFKFLKFEIEYVKFKTRHEED